MVRNGPGKARPKVDRTMFITTVRRVARWIAMMISVRVCIAQSHERKEIGRNQQARGKHNGAKAVVAPSARAAMMMDACTSRLTSNVIAAWAIAFETATADGLATAPFFGNSPSVMANFDWPLTGGSLTAVSKYPTTFWAKSSHENGLRCVTGHRTSR